MINAVHIRHCQHHTVCYKITVLSGRGLKHVTQFFSLLLYESNQLTSQFSHVTSIPISAQQTSLLLPLKYCYCNCIYRLYKTCGMCQYVTLLLPMMGYVWGHFRIRPTLCVCYTKQNSCALEIPPSCTISRLGMFNHFC